MKALLALLILVTGCGYFSPKNDHAETKQDLKALEQKRGVYLTLSKNQQDKYGFIVSASSKCDSTKFTGYYSVSGGTVEILQAESATEPGRFYRHAEHDCYNPNGNPPSGSDFSRDMALGLAHSLWHHAQPEVAQRFMDYVDSHEGRMGDGDPFRTDLRPGLAATFHAIINLSAGVPLPPKIENPDPEVPVDQQTQLTGGINDLVVAKGYEAELSVSHILLRGLIYKGVSDFELKLLKAQVDREPRNAFYQAVYHKFTDGDQAAALAILFDESLFPADRLPTTEQYCTDYLWQRDNSPQDWAPCPEKNEVHSGTDFLFATAVITGTLRQAP